MITASLTGFGFGMLVAAQVGPIWLLCARTALRGHRASAFAIGIGAATIDTAYAALGIAGMARLVDSGSARTILGVIGAIVLIALGARTIWSAFRIRAGGESDDEIATPMRALRTSLIATASNPSTIASWAALFAAASAASVTRTTGSAAAMLAGIAVGSLTWFAILTVVMSAVRAHIPDRGLRYADLVAGAGITGFGALLGWRALRG